MEDPMDIEMMDVDWAADLSEPAPAPTPAQNGLPGSNCTFADLAEAQFQQPSASPPMLRCTFAFAVPQRRTSVSRNHVREAQAASTWHSSDANTQQATQQPALTSQNPLNNLPPVFENSQGLRAWTFNFLTTPIKTYDQIKQQTRTEAEASSVYNEQASHLPQLRIILANCVSIAQKLQDKDLIDLYRAKLLEVEAADQQMALVAGSPQSKTIDAALDRMIAGINVDMKGEKEIGYAIKGSRCQTRRHRRRR
ncbi:hypothetical protein G7046_g2219 [Stylonectria norvegica]|nr:hypothetical protein G7046_g2219 [Stylonectria norvegica]